VNLHKTFKIFIVCFIVYFILILLSLYYVCAWQINHSNKIIQQP